MNSLTIPTDSPKTGSDPFRFPCPRGTRSGGFRLTIESDATSINLEHTSSGGPSVRLVLDGNGTWLVVRLTRLAEDGDRSEAEEAFANDWDSSSANGHRAG